MTEAEWLKCDDPGFMLDHLEGRTTDRKLRLFAVACCRRIWHLFDDERSRTAVEMTERYADGIADTNAYHSAMEAASLVDQEQGTGEPTPATAAWLIAYYPPFDAAYTCGITSVLADKESLKSRADWWETHVKEGEDEAKSQISLMRCIFGNPFRPVILDPAWLTPIVSERAQRIYDERVFDQMPLLAEALQATGCDDPEILNHCRNASEHAKGCWVIDLLLGKL